MNDWDIVRKSINTHRDAIRASIKVMKSCVGSADEMEGICMKEVDKALAALDRLQKHYTEIN